MNLSDPGTLRAFLARHGLTARKGLGQHFLCSTSAVSAIVAAVGDARGVLEIGPGPGVLTSALSEIAEVIALEVDDRMIEALGESAPKAKVLKQDALEANLPELLAELPEPRAIVSNLPYYITGPLLTVIASARRGFDVAVLMMQKEVGQRVLAEPGNRDRGSLSVFLQSQFAILRVANVPAGAFIPPPKVDSVVLQLVPLDAPNEPRLYELIRLGFTQPRKTLANNLATGLGVDREKVVGVLADGGMLGNVRPHELTLEQWRGIALAL